MSDWISRSLTRRARLAPRVAPKIDAAAHGTANFQRISPRFANLAAATTEPGNELNFVVPIVTCTGTPASI